MAKKKFEIEVDLKSKDAEKDLKKFNKTLDETNKKKKNNAKASKDAKGGLAGFTNGLGGATKALGLAAGAVGAITAGFVALNSAVLSVAAQTRELQNFARTAQLSVAEYQALAIGAERYGVSGEKASEMIQDFNDKLGDFVTTGAGPFNDLFLAIGKTSDLTVEKLQTLSGPDGLIAVKKAMDDASLSAKQQTFVLESLASDASKLSPLLADNAKELKNTNNELADSGAQLSAEQLKQLKEYEDSWRMVNEQFLVLKVELSSYIIPLLNTVGSIMSYLTKDDAALEVSDMIRNVPESTAQIELLTTKLDELKKKRDEVTKVNTSGNTFRMPGEKFNTNQQERLVVKGLTDDERDLIIAIERRLAVLKEIQDVRNKNKKDNESSTKKLNEKEQASADFARKTKEQLEFQLTLSEKLNHNYQFGLDVAKDVVTQNRLDTELEALKIQYKEKGLIVDTETLKLKIKLHDVNKDNARLERFGSKEQSLKRELALLSAATDEQRERLMLEHELFDLDLSVTQNAALTALNDQIIAREKHLEILEKEKEAVVSLAEAMGRWASGSKDAIKQVIAELIRLAAIKMFGGTSSFMGGFLSGFGDMRGFASGGQFDAGETFMVGERGPEIITASAPGSVVPNHQLGGSGGISISPQLIINGGVNNADELTSMLSNFSNEIASQTQHLIKTQLGPRGVFA